MITYHVWWPSAADPYYLANVTENTDRKNYYGINAVPWVFIDGSLNAGSSGPWAQWMLDRYDVDSPLTIAVTGHMDTGTTGTITATITNTSPGGVSGYLHFVLIEDGMQYGGRDYSHVMRDFIPTGTAGDLISLNPSDQLVRDAAFTINSGWVRSNLEAIVFVQNNTTKEIYQTGRVFFELDGPELRTNGLTVDDAIGGDGNGHLDPGESASLMVGLGNLNAPPATGVSGTLTTTNPYLTITDAASTWPDIAYWTTEQNTADPFGLTAASNTPYGTMASLSLSVSSNGGTYTSNIPITLGIGSPGHPIGPDTYGYYAYEDTDSYTPSPDYNWVEIDPGLGGPGTLFTMSDDQARQLDAPFTFKYYNTNQTRMTICSNGWIAWGNQTDATPGNGPIPGAAGPGNMVAAFWCDLDPSATGGGKVYTYLDATNHRYIVEFSGVEHYDDLDQGPPETFEFIVYDPIYYPTQTGDGEIVVQYRLISDASSCTVGIENATETVGIQYLALGQLNPAAAGLVPGRAIKYTTASPTAGGVNDGIRPPVVLLQSRPNPVRDGTHICYEIPAAGHITLRIFDATGAVVRTLIDGTVPAGPGMTPWDGRNDRGQITSAGVYFYRLNGEGFAVSRKIVKQD
jgi:hypothetical protein